MMQTAKGDGPSTMWMCVVLQMLRRLFLGAELHRTHPRETAVAKLEGASGEMMKTAEWRSSALRVKRVAAKILTWWVGCKPTARALQRIYGLFHMALPPDFEVPNSYEQRFNCYTLPPLAAGLPLADGTTRPAVLCDIVPGYICSFQEPIALRPRPCLIATPGKHPLHEYNTAKDVRFGAPSEQMAKVLSDLPVANYPAFNENAIKLVPTPGQATHVLPLHMDLPALLTAGSSTDVPDDKKEDDEKSLHSVEDLQHYLLEPPPTGDYSCGPPGETAADLASDSDLEEQLYNFLGRQDQQAHEEAQLAKESRRKAEALTYCPNCRENTHVERDCPQPRCCYLCLSKEHDKKECPMRALVEPITDGTSSCSGNIVPWTAKEKEIEAAFIESIRQNQMQTEEGAATTDIKIVELLPTTDKTGER